MPWLGIMAQTLRERSANSAQYYQDYKYYNSNTCNKLDRCHSCCKKQRCKNNDKKTNAKKTQKRSHKNTYLVTLRRKSFFLHALNSSNASIITRKTNTRNAPSTAIKPPRILVMSPMVAVIPAITAPIIIAITTAIIAIVHIRKFIILFLKEENNT